MIFPPLIEQFQRNRLLKELTTFGIGGPAHYFIEVREISLLQQLLPFCQAQQLPYFILGKGSNSLFDDRGFAGLVIANRIDFLEQPAPHLWHVGAGYSFSLLGSQTARKGWSGLEFASGIPASVGGAVYMNAGANGCETADTLVSVDVVTATGEHKCLPREEISFAYRHSSFHNQADAIVGATFSLTPAPLARKRQLEIIDYRKKTQPYGDKSAGCVFRNPPTMSAGALIEKMGLKGKTWGEAQVSTQHANFVINKGTASAQDVLDLMAYIRQEVKTKAGIDLTAEIRFIPYTSSSKDIV